RVDGALNHGFRIALPDHVGSSEDRDGLRSQRGVVVLGVEILVEIARDPLKRSRSGGGETKLLGELPGIVLLQGARPVAARLQPDPARGCVIHRNTEYGSYVLRVALLVE